MDENKLLNEFEFIKKSFLNLEMSMLSSFKDQNAKERKISRLQISYFDRLFASQLEKMAIMARERGCNALAGILADETGAVNKRADAHAQKTSSAFTMPPFLQKSEIFKNALLAMGLLLFFYGGFEILEKLGAPAYICAGLGFVILVLVYIFL